MIPKLFDFLNDWYINIVLVFFCIFLLIQSSGYPETARTFPQLVLLFLFLLVIMNIINAILDSRKSDGVEINQQDGPNDKGAYEKKGKEFKENKITQHLFVLFTILLMFVFLLLIHLVGFIMGTFIFLTLGAWSLGYKNLKNLFFSSIGITCFMYLIFVVIMKSLLPQGLIIEYFLR